MSGESKIEWTDSTFNPWIGCTKVSPGCDHCYAEAWDRRFAESGHAMHWGTGKARRRTSESNWRQPVRWNAAHDAFLAEHGRRRRVFCASLADVFDNEVPPEWRVDLFDLIRRCENLDFLLLTKRVGNVTPMLREIAALLRARAGRAEVGLAHLHREYLAPRADLLAWVERWLAGAPPPNVWIGATVVNQEEADRDIPKLLATPAAVRFVSIEPLLGDIRLGSFLQRSPSAAFANGCVTPDMPAWTRIGATAIDWVICGGESGRHARPMHPDWARSLRDECS
ncbi:MAG: phage Gp37/Gp68 family protein, partial [Anaerolineae bacterium]|nr:phage Gp37/Gp68 family protein [Anaerolineae bacterium]